MMLLARKVDHRRWLHAVPRHQPGPSADALTRDLQTRDDKLSCWAVDGSTEEIAIAIASTRDSVSYVDLALVATEDIDNLGISWEWSLGKTPYAPVRDRHCDLINLSARAVTRLADHFHENRNGIKRLREGDVRALLIATIGEGHLEIKQIKTSLLTSLATRLCKMDDPNPAALTAVLEEVQRRVEAGDLGRETLDARVAERIGDGAGG